MARVPIPRRLLVLIPAVLVTSAVLVVVSRHSASEPVQLAHDRFSAATVVPNDYRPVAEMIASSDGLTPPSSEPPASVAQQFIIANRDVLGLAPATNTAARNTVPNVPTREATDSPATSPPVGNTPNTAASTPVTPPNANVDEPPREIRQGDTVDGQWFRFEQTVSGVPVYGGEIVVAVNDSGQVVSSTVKSAEVPSIEPQFNVAPSDAQQAALDVAAKRTGLDPAVLAATTPQPVWFDPTVLATGTPSGTARAVYQINVTSPQQVDLEVLIDANAGVPALVIDRVETVERRICDGGNAAGPNLDCTAAKAVPSPSTSTVTDVNNAYQIAGATADFYTSRLGRSSYDGIGSPLIATVRACQSSLACPMANAFWSGDQAVFGANFVTDDVVGHEFTHGVIESTAGLMYYGQSGAINEALADIFGELIDHTTTIGGNDAGSQIWQVGEGVSGIGPIRNMANPPSRGHPDKMTSTYYRGGSFDNYGVHLNSGVLNKAAYLIDAGDTFNGYTITGLGDVLTAKLFYQALTATLVPGSDYADLAVALPQACQQLVAAGIATQTNCQSVTKAVAATEMAKPPTVAGAVLTAATCDTGTAVSPPLFADDAEAGLTKWATSASVATATWTSATSASQSGTHSFFGPDIGQPADASLALASPLALPLVDTTAGDRLFLRFDHTFGFESDSGENFDGGVVEYEINGDGNWHDLKDLVTVNGYNGVLSNPSAPANPLAGRSAFTGYSPGFQTTRVDLTSLAGQSIKLRFRIGSDNYVGDYGWHIDDVKIYQCATTSVTTTTKPPTTTTTTTPTTTATTTTTTTTTTTVTTASTTTVAPPPSTTGTTLVPTTVAPTTPAPTPTVAATTLPPPFSATGGATTNQGAQRGPSIQIS